MLRIVLFILVSTGVAFTAAPAAAAAPAVDQHQLHLELQPAANRLLGSDRISLANAGEQPLLFRLASDCEISRITIDGQPARYRRVGSRLEILPTTDDGPVQIVEISYTARFVEQPPATPSHHEDPGYGVIASISLRGSYLSGGLAWYPQRVGVKQRLDIRVTAPAGYHAVTAGRRDAFADTAEGATSSWRVGHPVDGLALAAGPFRVHEARAGKIPVYAYFYAGSSPLVADYLAATVAYLDLYQQRFGPYPFDKFAIVENFFPSGYGFPSWTLLGSSVVRLPFIVKTSLGHEIAHSWWGNGVLADYDEGNWAEGLTTYVADYLYQEQDSTAAARDYRLKILRDYATLRNDREFPVTGFSARHDKLSQVIGYGKVAMLFHMLRQRVGDAAFWATLRQLAAERMFSRVGWSELLQRFAQLSGQPLAEEFQVWLRRPGAPQLQLAGVRSEPTAEGWLTSGTLRQLGEPWPLQAKYRLQTEDGASDRTISLNGPAGELRIRSGSRPVSLSVDPDADLFRLLASEEIPASINHLRASEQLLVVILPGQDAALPALRTLLSGLRKSGVRQLTLSEYRRQAPVDADLIFFGRPTAADLPGIIGDNPLSAGPAEAGHAMLTLRRQARLPKRVVAIYQPGETAFAEQVARKIPHYGKYSQLEFAAGQNVAKSISAPAVDPLQIIFPSAMTERQ